jgi:hypothetical protein
MQPDRRRVEALRPSEPPVDEVTLHAVSSTAEAGNDGRKLRPRKPVAPAESGRPETAKEFSKRIKRVVLRVGERPEGGSTGRAESSAHAEANQNTATLPPMLPVAPNHSIEDATIRPTSPPMPSLAPAPPESLLAVIAADGLDLLDSIRGLYSGDKTFTSIMTDVKQFKNFAVDDGLVYIKDGGRKCLCIPNGCIAERSVREIIISHAHSILAHLGPTKTTAYLRDQVWWKTMAADIAAFINSCSTCKRSKPNDQKPYGLLNPLTVPSKPWQAIGVDFVGPLPPSKNRDATFDMLVVVIDLLTGYVSLTPGRTDYKAKEMAELIFAEVYKRHGLPERIISDRDVLFTSTFWSHLHKLLGISLRMSSAYHPETDGSTERANRTVTTMLRQCVSPSQTDWVAKLPGIEYAINSARSESTGYAPFFLNTGRMPRSMIWNNPGIDEYPSVRAFAQRMKLAVMSAHNAILDARVKQTRAANRARRPAPFTEQELVFISTKNISFPKGRARKLIPKYIGPYRILKDYGNNSYQIALPARLRQRGVHDVFHSSLLRVYIPNDDRLFPGRAENQVAEFGDDEQEWAADRILSHCGRGTDSVFEVLWKPGDISWLNYDSIKNLPIFQTYLDLQNVSSIKELGAGKGTPPNHDPQIFVSAIGVKTVGFKTSSGIARPIHDAHIPLDFRGTRPPTVATIRPNPRTRYNRRPQRSRNMSGTPDDWVFARSDGSVILSLGHDLKDWLIPAETVRTVAWAQQTALTGKWPLNRGLHETITSLARGWNLSRLSSRGRLLVAKKNTVIPNSDYKPVHVLFGLANAFKDPIPDWLTGGWPRITEPYGIAKVDRNHPPAPGEEVHIDDLTPEAQEGLADPTAGDDPIEAVAALMDATSVKLATTIEVKAAAAAAPADGPPSPPEDIDTMDVDDGASAEPIPEPARVTKPLPAGRRASGMGPSTAPRADSPTPRAESPGPQRLHHRPEPYDTDDTAHPSQFSSSSSGRKRRHSGHYYENDRHYYDRYEYDHRPYPRYERHQSLDRYTEYDVEEPYASDNEVLNREVISILRKRQAAEKREAYARRMSNQGYGNGHGSGPAGGRGRRGGKRGRGRGQGRAAAPLRR